jgi:hypothetical protein
VSFVTFEGLAHIDLWPPAAQLLFILLPVAVPPCPRHGGVPQLIPAKQPFSFAGVD